MSRCCVTCRHMLECPHTIAEALLLDSWGPGALLLERLALLLVVRGGLPCLLHLGVGDHNAGERLVDGGLRLYCTSCRFLPFWISLDKPVRFQCVPSG